MTTKNQRNCRRRLWHRLLYSLIGLAIPVCYVAWELQKTKSELFGFQPPEMALAQYTPKDIIGDLGGMKVRIPRHYAEYVEYDGVTQGLARNAKGLYPSARLSRKLRSFGMEARFPDMKGLETSGIREEYRRYNLKPDNPWIHIGINAGEVYPKLGDKAQDARAKKLWEHSPYWWNNFERLPDGYYGLEACVVSGVDPKTSKPARESDSTQDIYIHREASGRVDTYIWCGKTSVPGGIARCNLEFGLEPKANVALNVSFYPALLPKWQVINQSIYDLFMSFEVQDKVPGRLSKDVYLNETRRASV